MHLLPGNENGAGEGNRTLVVSLGSFYSTIELHPHDKITLLNGSLSLPYTKRISNVTSHHKWSTSAF